MRCYFCRSPLRRTDSYTRPDGSIWSFYESCDYCTEKHDVSKVFTTFTEGGLISHAHIYVSANHSRQWHVRLHLKENFTYVGDPEGYESPLRLPGFPINPANAKDKIKLYLLFS